MDKQQTLEDKREVSRLIRLRRHLKTVYQNITGIENAHSVKSKKTKLKRTQMRSSIESRILSLRLLHWNVIHIQKYIPRRFHCAFFLVFSQSHSWFASQQRQSLFCVCGGYDSVLVGVFQYWWWFQVLFSFVSKSSNVPELSIHNGKRVRLLSKFNLSLTIRQFGHKTAIPGAEILYGKISNRSKMPPALSGGGGAHTWSERGGEAIVVVLSARGGS